ncbi:MAG: ABC transporter permease [Treponema sp.]|jgi:ABC-type nitrate/sulfonate/bicarbonate transport system permease component|nr:ABC transporter permease [Treponema sp.]
MGSNRPSWIGILALVLLWQGISAAGLVPPYMLPGPFQVGAAFVRDRSLLMGHLGHTLFEAAGGLLLAVAAAFLLALGMDAKPVLKAAVMPVLLLTQTVPAIALAPLLVLWLGYGVAPKITLVFLTCFFPLTIGLLDGFAQADTDAIRLLQSMGANRVQLYWYIKFPGALAAFFSGLKIASAYSIVGAVISEWLGGNAGLGVYMTRVRKSYSFDKMFAVILLVAVLSLGLLKLVELLERRAMPWMAREALIYSIKNKSVLPLMWFFAVFRRKTRKTIGQR